MSPLLLRPSVRGVIFIATLLTIGSVSCFCIGNYGDKPIYVKSPYTWSDCPTQGNKGEPWRYCLDDESLSSKFGADGGIHINTNLDQTVRCQ